jgi:hypothetical protein
MSVALDSYMTGGNGTGTSGPGGIAGTYQYMTANGTSISTSGHTVGPSATLLVVGLTIGTANCSAFGCTWNGLAMKLAMLESYHNGLVYCQTGIFTLVNPTPGAKALVASWVTGSPGGYLTSIAFTGTDTVTGYQASDNVTGGQNSGAANVVINTAAGDATFCMMGNNGGVPGATTQTQLFSSGASAPNGGASYALGGSGSNTHSFNGGTNQVEAWAGIHILAGAASMSQSGLLLRGL